MPILAKLGPFPSKPWVGENFGDRDPFINISIEHLADQIYATFGKRQEGYSKWVIQNFVDIIERILFVDDSVEQNAKSPHVLFFAPVCFALKDLGCGVVCS
jgi:hypothetical protein